jgi:hypothetical protein
MRAQDRFGAEQRQLRVVRHGAEASVDLREIADSFWAKPRNDFSAVHELNRSTERVTHGAPKEDAAKSLRL